MNHKAGTLSLALSLDTSCVCPNYYCLDTKNENLEKKICNLVKADAMLTSWRQKRLKIKTVNGEIACNLYGKLKEKDSEIENSM